MTTEKLRLEIHKAIDKLPDSALPEVLNYLSYIQSRYPDTSHLKEIIDRIFGENDGLLKRLAEN